MKVRFGRTVLRLFSALLLFGALATAAAAQDVDRAALEAKKDQLFQQMLANPANLDVVFAYADVSAQLGDNEAAVAAHELSQSIARGWWPGLDHFVGKVTLKQVEDIAKQKMPDLNAASVDAAIRSVRGTARSMGIEVVG